MHPRSHLLLAVIDHLDEIGQHGQAWLLPVLLGLLPEAPLDDIEIILGELRVGLALDLPMDLGIVSSSWIPMVLVGLGTICELIISLLDHGGAG